MKKTKTSLLHSGLALLLCISMLIGSTFAWFSDSISSGKNIITAGNLDLEMYWTDDLDSDEWYNVEDPAHNTIFNYDNWEPGYTDVKYIKLVNVGELALNYKLSLTPQNGVGKLAEVINVYFAEGGVNVQNRSDLSNLGAIGLLSNVMNGGATAGGTLLAADQASPLHPSGEVIMTVAMSMITSAGNEYQNEDSGNFTITALATQASFESDSFGSDYDANAEYPVILTAKQASASVTAVDNKVPAGGVSINGDGISATVPEGVLLDEDTNKLTLSITPLEHTTSDITAVNNEILIPVDVHIDGVSENNTVPIIIELGEILPQYLNMGNYTLIHVENGVNTLMTCVEDSSELTAHNRFTYNADTGAVTVAMASFSEITFIADEGNPWNGEFDHDLNGSGTASDPYIISSADELAGFGAIVGGMNGQAQNSYTGKYVKLISNINLGDADGASQHIFYPIGYYNSEYTYEKTGNSITSGFQKFEGVFDGAGHTIANFYHNTWEMKGDNEYYTASEQCYRDGMGLFGKVYGGTVKNLTVSNFSSDGEYTTTGVIAAYADSASGKPATFENIAIVNCNPRVYNIGNGGIVGCGGWYSRSESLKTEGYTNAITFNNITVDNTNKISALWGSWDVACGGLMGQYYPDSGSGVDFNNCHVAAQIDVYNDVCANYQYYAYRYSGMMIGSIRNNLPADEKGHVYPDMTGISASNCTVHFGDWNDYYYCELVANSLASYTHDHQFSRLTQVEAVDAVNMTYTPIGGTPQAIPTSGRYNYVVVKGDHATENATCYHFVDGNVHSHDDYNGDGETDYETVGGQKLLVENNRHIYLEFNNLFTGYGWGVTSKGLTDFEGITSIDIQHGDKEESIKKFEFADTIPSGYLFRVGNGDAFTIDKLFKAIDGADINETGVYVSVSSKVEGEIISGTFTLNKDDWKQSTLKLNGTGLAMITIQDYDYCTPTVLYVEVVNGYNVTEYSQLKNRNSVLLNDITMTSGGTYYLNSATLYGNGFTFDVKDGAYNGTGNLTSNYLIGLSNATLDNVKVVGKVYSEYSFTASDNGNRACVFVSGNSVIANSYIANCAAPVRVGNSAGTNLLLQNTTLKGGSLCNLDLRGGNVTIDGLTTINQVNSNDKNEEGTPILGLGILVYNEGPNGSEVITIKDSGLTQYNYGNENQQDNVVNNAVVRQAFSLAFGIDEDYVKTIGNVRWVNTGILDLYGITVEGLPDSYGDVTVKLQGYGEGKLYTIKQTAFPSTLPVDAPTYAATEQYHIAPTTNFEYPTAAGKKNYLAKSDGSSDYCYYDSTTKEILIGFEQGSSFAFDPHILTVTKNGKSVTPTVSLDNVTGAAYDGEKINFTEGGTYTITYTYADPSNYKDNGELDSYAVTYVKTITVRVIAAVKVDPAVFNFNGITAKTEIAGNDTYVMPDVSATSGTIGSKTVSGETIYYPLVYVKTATSTSGSLSASNSSTSLSKSANSIAFCPVFDGVVTIIDNNKTYGSSTTTLAEGKLQMISDPEQVLKWHSANAVPTNNPVVKSNKLYFQSATIQGVERDQTTFVFEYVYTDTAGNVYHYYVGYIFPKKAGTCVTSDTLVTLADGTQKRIDEVTYDDQLLVWDFDKGEYTVAGSSIIENHGYDNSTVIKLTFEDGTIIKAVNAHGFFDADLNKWVDITGENAQNYIGHNFTQVNGDSYKNVKLVAAEVSAEYIEAWSILTADYYNCILEGMFSVTPPATEHLAFFEIGADMKYDAKAKHADIEEYGLYTYDEFAHLMTEEQFEAFNIAEIKIAIGKGLITYEEVLELLATYA